MAQRIQNSGMSIADETLPLSSLNRGLGAMNPPNMGMKNEFDGGMLTKMDAPQDTRPYQMQNIQQNTVSAAAQQNVGARGQVTQAMTEQDSQNSRTHQFKTAYTANVMDNSESKGEGMKILNREMEKGPKLVNDIAISADMWRNATPNIT